MKAAAKAKVFGSTLTIILCIMAVLCFGVPPYAASLTDNGLRAEDLSFGTKLVIDAANVLRYYWPFAVPFLAILLAITLVYAVRARQEAPDAAARS